jgi:hypothetical protein
MTEHLFFLWFLASLFRYWHFLIINHNGEATQLL